ncbi:MAG: hypothetical protein JWP27_1802 [Flaviaesturariibacter sp.]|nr:hypothetical protein [Flaviaesturariibacter sp.]
MRSIDWHIGCSGFHYKDWKEIFYPKGLAQSKWFDHYAQVFNTLELNVTFYRFPKLPALKGWYDKAPGGFSFSAKVPRSVTHYKRFAGTETLLSDFYATLREGLADKLACVLFQLPPQLSFSEDRLDLILTQLDHSFTNVMEFRHESWWRPDVMARLRKHKVSFSGVSYPRIAHDEAVVTDPVAYYRFHGVPKLFYSEYSESFMRSVVEQIKTARGVKKAYLYFNNTASTAALQNAQFVQQLVS